MPASKSVSALGIGIILLLAGSGIGCAAVQRAPLATVIEPNEFASRWSERSVKRLVILDARDLSAYQAGHIAGAIWADPAVWKDESLKAETGLDHDDLWRGRIGSLGITGDDPVVIYDDGRMTEAARLWFIFQHFGVAEAAVLNGGYGAIERVEGVGRPAISGRPTVARLVKFRPKSGGTEVVGLIERQRVLRSIERREAQVFDSRSQDEFFGRKLLTNQRGGHLPTAINLPHTQLLDEKGRLKAPEALAQLFAEAGFERGRPIITHCQGGGRASLAALAAQRAGYGPILNYYLSFGDWAADASCPVESGE